MANTCRTCLYNKFKAQFEPYWCRHLRGWFSCLHGQVGRLGDDELVEYTECTSFVDIDDVNVARRLREEGVLESR